MSDSDHFFGGKHTETKLTCLREYLSAYSIALKEQNFARVYIDAFAGTGSRTEEHAALPILGMSEPEIVTTEGSAIIALKTNPAFHHIALIERDETKISSLEKLIERSKHTRARVRHGDANSIVRDLCQKIAWRGPGTIGNGIRGVIFLDPYGMEVEWATVEAIAQTQALDCWYFFPLSGLYRNAPHDPLDLDEHKITSLNRVLGTEQWRTDWYDRGPDQKDLFGTHEHGEKRVADVDAIEKYVQNRLKSVFKGTVLAPLRLKNSSGAPLASLFFAVSNPSGSAIKLATVIASHILKAGSSSHVR